MGSLPNLHELGKENPGIGYKPTPALGHLCGGNAGRYTLSQHERNKILHRHSAHAKVNKTRSCGNDPCKIIDDLTLEHMATYSPISGRTNRQFHQIKRRDSLNSSIGATSVRRLLAVVRNGPSNSCTNRSVPIGKHNLMVNLVVLCVTHLIVIAAHLPYLTLQSSVSVWSKPDDVFEIDINIGSYLLSLSHLIAAILSLIAPSINQFFATNTVLLLSYFLFTVHYGMIAYPALYVLIPSSFIFGVSMAMMSNAHHSSLMAIVIKMTNLSRNVEEEEEIKSARQGCLIRRAGRAFKAAHDFGLILGSMVSAFVISWTVNREGWFDPTNKTDIGYGSNATIYEYTAFLDDIFDIDGESTRLCGSNACPSSYPIGFNGTSVDKNGDKFLVVPGLTTKSLAGTFSIFCLAATLLVLLGMDHLKLQDRQDCLASIRNVRECLRDRWMQLVLPMAVFVGLEQAFIYGDFGKSYVVCTLGVHRLNLVFLTMGLLQSIAAATLSMLLRSIQRYYIVGVGFLFHSCLLMVLILWKPMEDDPALFYVISAAWGVCNAIWEVLSFSLLTSQFSSDRWQAAFAVTTSFKYFGLSVAFGAHGILCNDIKLYGLAFFLLSAVVSFVYLDVKLENLKKLKNISRL